MAVDGRVGVRRVLGALSCVPAHETALRRARNRSPPLAHCWTGSRGRRSSALLLPGYKRGDRDGVGATRLDARCSSPIRSRPRAQRGLHARLCALRRGLRRCRAGPSRGSKASPRRRDRGRSASACWASSATRRRYGSRWTLKRPSRLIRARPSARSRARSRTLRCCTRRSRPADLRRSCRRYRLCRRVRRRTRRRIGLSALRSSAGSTASLATPSSSSMMSCASSSSRTSACVLTLSHA